MNKKLKEQIILANQDFFRTLPLCISDKVETGYFGGVFLKAPKSFWYALKHNPDLIKVMCGGCGPGGFGDWFVPDTMWGLCVTPACVIHDWCFQVWNTERQFKLANKLFKENMVIIIRGHNGGRIIVGLRLLRSKTYKFVVSTKMFGYKAFLDNHLAYIREIA